MHDDNAPCFVFDEVPGTIQGSRVLVNFFGGKRKNMTLGFPTELSKIELSEGFRTHYGADAKRIPPTYVTDGPVIQNVMRGDEVDVTSFPAPHLARKDGGRYIGTGSFNITRDPDEGWINCGTYRVMIHDAKTAGFYISPGKHGRQMRDKYQARGEPMPVAVVCGGDPMTFLMACSEVPYGVSEYEIVGGMRGTPIEVIEGPVTGLPIPANAEIVVEGFVAPGNERVEGPFGEWTGYYASDVRPEPVIDIKAVYHRNDPILLGCAPQRPPDEICRYRAVVRSGLLRENILKAGVPGVTAAWAHEVGNARLLLAVAINQRYPGHAKQAGHIAAMCHVGAYCGPLRDRGRRRHRRVQPRGADLGVADAVDPADLDRHHPRRVVDPARSEDRARAQGGRRLHQQPGDHRRLPAVALARQVPARERALAGGAPHGTGEVWPPVRDLIRPGGLTFPRKPSREAWRVARDTLARRRFSCVCCETWLVRPAVAEEAECGVSSSA